MLNVLLIKCPVKSCLSLSNCLLDGNWATKAFDDVRHQLIRDHWKDANDLELFAGGFAIVWEMFLRLKVTHLWKVWAIVSFELEQIFHFHTLLYLMWKSLINSRQSSKDALWCPKQMSMPWPQTMNTDSVSCLWMSKHLPDWCLTTVLVWVPKVCCDITCMVESFVINSNLLDTVNVFIFVCLIM